MDNYIMHGPQSVLSEDNVAQIHEMRYALQELGISILLQSVNC